MEVGMIDTGRRELISGLHWMGRMRVRLPLVNYVIKVGQALSMVNYFIKVGLARSMVNYVIKVGLALSMENYHIKIGLALSTVDYVMVIGLALSTVDYVMVIGLALSTVDYVMVIGLALSTADYVMVIGLMASNLNYFNVIGLALMVAIYIKEEGKGKAYVVDKVTGTIMEVEDILRTQHWSRVVRDPSGNGEKGQLLKVLTTSSTSSTASQLASHLRQWRRCFTRAREIGACVPDGTLMVYALESSATALGKIDGQAAFRIASSRAQLEPEAEMALLYSQVLLAEAETLTLSGTSTTTSGGVAAPKVKALQTQTGKGGSQTSSTTSTCKFWGSESGGKYGKQCKFAHPEITGPEGQKRCWICSATTHRKMDCPYKNHDSAGQQPEALAGGSADGGGKGKGSKSFNKFNKNGNSGNSKGDGKSKHDASAQGKDGPAVNKVTTSASDEAAIRGDGPPQKQQQDGGTGDAPAAADGLMTEVTSLLKSLRVATQRGPQIRAYRLKSAEVQGEGRSVGRMLLDGGATHCLRQPNSNKEWEESVPVQVQLASGQVDMRIHPRNNSLLTYQQVQNIIPLSKITELGYEVRWLKSGCEIRHQAKGVVPLEMQQGCPTVDENWGKKLMNEVEEAEESRMALRKVLLGQQQPQNAKEEAVRRVQQLHKGGDSGPPPLRGRGGESRFGLPELSDELQSQVDVDSALWLRTLYWFYLSHCSNRNTKYFLEQPLDPEEWIKEGDCPTLGAPSFTVWPETEWLIKELSLSKSKFEQGALGHPVPKPTVGISNLEEVRQLNGLRCSSYDASAWQIPLDQRIEKSKKLAAWSEGLKQVLCRAICRIHRGEPPAVMALTAKEKSEVQAWIEHHRAGHLPFRKDCPTCLLGAGQNRQHRRLACPSSYVLSLDIAGPFIPGVDQEIKGPRYGLVAVYSVPANGEGVPLPEGLVELRNQTRMVADEDDDIDVEEVDQDSHGGQPVRSLTFGVPLKSREASDVVAAVAQGLLQGSVQCSSRLDRDLYHTMSPGDEPQSNARAEREVGMVKARMRTALRAGGAPDHFWPLAFRFGVEQRHRQQLQALGIQCPSLLPFGCKAIARRKTWHQRADPFRWPTLRVKLWGPASGMTASSNGYFVEDPEGKFFRSTVVFTHADEVVPSEEGAGQEQDRQSGEILQQEHPMVPGSLPGGEETVDAQGHNVDSGEDEKEKGNDKAKYIQDAINNFEVLVEKANDKGAKDGNQRGSKTGAPDTAKDGNQRGSKTGAPDTGKDGNQRGSETGAPDIGKDGNQSTDPLASTARHHHPSGVVTVMDGRGESELERELEEIENENSFEHLLLHQHRGLMNWIKEVAVEVAEGTAAPEEVECAVKAKRNLEEWKPAFQEEINNLSEKAIEKIGEKDFRSLLQSGQEIECLPMKAVATLKPPNRRKGRVVVCGNYSSPKEGEQNENSASGADSACVRALLNVAMHRNWTAGSVDIKAAFLQAPRRNSSKRLTICDPPSVLKAMNLVAPSEKWIIKQALYGLVESPADWGAHRDEVLRGFTWYEDGGEFALVETAERHVWRVTQRNDPKAEHGYLLTYVDDMLVVGPKGKIQKVVELIQGRWECSQPEFLSTEKSMKFCGYDLKLVDDGLKISQEGYTRDLVARYGITSAEAFPLPKIEESEGPEEFSIAELRRAQSIVGEILWLSTKSRPDVAFATGALGRMVHQHPNYAFGLGLHVLKEILVPAIIYNFLDQHPGSTSMLTFPTPQVMRDTVRFRESLLNTEEMLSFGKAADSRSYVTQRQKVNWLLYGDNKAALSAATMETGSWRTRHLRLRAHALRNALATPESRWAARHMPGRHLIADGLTKPLQGAAFMNFVDKLGLSNGGEKPKICRVAAGTCFGETLWSRVVLCSVALLGMNQLVLAAIVLAAGLLWKEGTRPIRAEEPRPHKSLRKLWMEGQNPPREEDEVAHPPSNRKGTVFLGDSWSHKDEEGKGVGSGLRAFEQAQDDEGCSSSHGHGAMGFGASCCDGIFGGQPCIRAFRGPPGRGSGAAERGKAATQRSEKKDLG
eukprot:symbB.v1.2.008386.t2/scaffold525.1/size192214/11